MCVGGGDEVWEEGVAAAEEGLGIGGGVCGGGGAVGEVAASPLAWLLQLNGRGPSGKKELPSEKRGEAGGLGGKWWHHGGRAGAGGMGVRNAAWHPSLLTYRAARQTTI